MSNLHIAVSGADAVVTLPLTLTGGMVGASVSFSFSGSDWAALEKTAVFRAGDICRNVVQSDWDDDVCAIPWECLQNTGERLLIGVYGTDTDGHLVIPTVYADCGWIQPGVDPTGDPAAEPGGPFYAPLLEQALAKAKASGLFDGPPGPQGDPGVPGPSGSGFTALGLYSSTEALMTAHPSGSTGDAWFVGTAESNTVYQWDTDSQAWVNIGPLRGAAGANGRSAYQSALLGGYDGSESSFNTALAAVEQKADRSAALTVSLPAAGWDTTTRTLTAAVSGLPDEGHLVVSAAPDSFAAYSRAGVRCTGHTSGTLTFQCETLPTETLTAQVLLLA